MNASSALARVARLGLALAGPRAIRTVALAVWHGDEPLTLDSTTGPYRADAAYLLERLAYYNIVSQGRKRALLGQVRRMRHAEGLVEDTDGQELIFRLYLPLLQPLQTRHWKPGEPEPLVEVVPEAELWAFKRANQARDMELVRSGKVKASAMGWFTPEMARKAKVIGAPY